MELIVIVEDNAELSHNHFVVLILIKHKEIYKYFNKKEHNIWIIMSRYSCAIYILN